MIKEKILRYLIKHDPELCAEIFAQDFVGIVSSRTVDNNALRFLTKYSSQLEPWILSMNHTLQREQTLYGHKLRGPGFYEGAMFILKIFYTKVGGYVPKSTITKPEVKTTINDPISEVEAFEQGFKEKDNGQEKFSEGESGEVQNV